MSLRCESRTLTKKLGGWFIEFVSVVQVDQNAKCYTTIEK